MATQGGRADPPVERRLFDEGYRFDFFQAVRVLERVYPHRRPVGGDASPQAEIAHFRTHISLDFPPSAIHKVKAPEASGAPAEVSVTFMGLAGRLGVLPRHYTELILARSRQRDETLRAFLDLFNHRLIAFLYRAWEKHHFPVPYERAARSPGSRRDLFSQGLLALVGIGTKGLLERLDVHDRALMFYAGFLSRRCRSASALEGLLRDYFQVPASVIQLTGKWLPIPEGNRTRLGRASNQLGGDAIAGSRVWDPHAKFTVKIGPVGFESFCQFLPPGDAFRPLCQLTGLFAGEEFDFDVQLVLRAADVPQCRLGGSGGAASRLGWSTWLKVRPFHRDADDAVFTQRIPGRETNGHSHGG